MVAAAREERIREVGLALFTAAARAPRGVSRHAVAMRLLEWAMRDERFKVQLFHFVDALPMLSGHEDLLDHLVEYLGADGVSFPLLESVGARGLRAAAANRIAGPALATMTRAQVAGMARSFIAGANAAEALAVIRRLRARGMTFTLDILGEVTVSEAEALAYQRQYLELLDALATAAHRWPAMPALDSAAGEDVPRLNLSLKLSALYSQFEPADPEGTAAVLRERLRPILDRAKAAGAFINIDMEHSAVKATTLRVARDLLLEDAYRDWPHLGLVLQAYVRDAEQDARDLLAVAVARGTPITIRLVKGAYWDSETILARQRGWPSPVYTRKHETDAAFERLTALLLDHAPLVRLAIASHNVRSIAAAIVAAEERGLPPDALEFQMLYGMGDQLKHAVTTRHHRLRVYTPCGALLPGMAYLVRRLLENTANTSFLRQGFTEKVAPAALLANPAEVVSVTAPTPTAGFQNLPERNFALAADQRAMRAALARAAAGLGQSYPLVIGGRELETGREIVSVNPARPSEVIGRVASAGQAEAQQAVEAATAALPAWRARPAVERAALLRAAADAMTRARDDLAALQVYEVGKGWREADADVCETVDYLRYYAGEMERLAGLHPLAPLPGEANSYGYAPKGVALVLAPWNFPMAILAGMTAAALVTGNTVIVKPAPQAPICGAVVAEHLRRAGIPDGALNFLPGPAEEIGDFLVGHPGVHLIVFTGSRQVGCHIVRLAAEVAPGQRHLKKVIAEMGGKNAIIVDRDADLDEAVLGTVQSAFGYGGQKCSACSRVIVLDPLHDRFVERLVAAARSLRIGPPQEPGYALGPLIDERARAKALRYIALGTREATLAYQAEVAHLAEGYYVGPAIFTDVPPAAAIAREEIFGPVLAVLRARDLDDALALANDGEYALTGGLYSRHPGHIARVKRDFAVGNLYINRKITGAIVARQPFGGFRLSGTGTKAGGPDYLLHFMDPRTITEQTLRRGFAPETM